MKRIISILLVVFSLFAISCTCVFASEETTATKLESATIEEGTYIFENLSMNTTEHKHYILDILDQSNEDGAFLILGTPKSTDNQKFTIEKSTNEGAYYIKSESTGKYLFLDETNTIVLNSQKTEFSFEKCKDDWVYIRITGTDNYIKPDDTMHMEIRKMFVAPMQESLYLKWRLQDPSTFENNTNSTEAITQASETPAATSSFPWMIVGIIGGVVLIAVLVTVIVIIKKKN